MRNAVNKLSHIAGYDEARRVGNVRFENVTINGRLLDLSQDVIIGPYVSHIES
jgi:hypothetical protein